MLIAVYVVLAVVVEIVHQELMKDLGTVWKKNVIELIAQSLCNGLIRIGESAPRTLSIVVQN